MRAEKELFDPTFFYYKNRKINGFYGIEIFPARNIIENLGFLRGDGVVEVIESRGGVIFHKEDHFRRLFAGVEELGYFLPGITVNFDAFKVFLKEKIDRLLRIYKARSRSIIHIMVVGGSALDTFTPLSSSLFIFTYLFKILRFNEKGISILPLEHQREWPEIKTINYQAAITALRKNPDIDLDMKYDEVLYGTHKILEASKANISIVTKDGRILTPATGILKGVTREIVLQLAKEIGCEAQEKELYWRDVFNASEVFLTSTTKFIRPVRRVGPRTYQIGPVSKRLWYAFMKYREQYYKNKKT
ncbi:aminotransferase class IV [Patescibacteria group bacterium]|nr:aminotransferase class IV [Patescibacteria group bacterium]